MILYMKVPTKWIMLFCILFIFIFSLYFREDNEYFTTINDMVHQVGFKKKHSSKTPYQKIDVIQFEKNSHEWDKCVFIDDKVHMCTNERYHDLLAEIPMSYLKSPKNALIIGGSDGQLLSVLLNHPTIQRIDVIDIDKKLAKIMKKHYDNKIFPTMKKVNFIIGDATAMIDSAPNKIYNLVIVDIFKEFKGEPSLNTYRFFRRCKQKLDSSQGIFIKRGGLTKKDIVKKEELEGSKDFEINASIYKLLKPLFKQCKVIKIRNKNLGIDHLFTICSSTVELNTQNNKYRKYYQLT